jgi:hypothetical protein
MPVKIGEEYVLIAGHNSVKGRKATVDAIDADGQSVEVHVGKKSFRCRVTSLATAVDGSPIQAPAKQVSERGPKQPKGVSTREISNTGAAGTGTKLNSYQRRKLKAAQQNGASGTEVEDLRFTARKADDTHANDHPVVRVGQWPKILPRSFTVDDVTVEPRSPTQGFSELYEVDLRPEGAGVGLIWKSAHDGMWRGLGGAGSTYETKAQALADLVRRRQPDKTNWLNR